MTLLTPKYNFSIMIRSISIEVKHIYKLTQIRLIYTIKYHNLKHKPNKVQMTPNLIVDVIVPKKPIIKFWNGPNMLDSISFVLGFLGQNWILSFLTSSF